MSGAIPILPLRTSHGPDTENCGFDTQIILVYLTEIKLELRNRIKCGPYKEKHWHNCHSTVAAKIICLWVTGKSNVFIYLN